MTHYRNFRVNEKTNVRVPMMTNKGNYLAAADHDLDCDILQVGGQSLTKMFSQTGTCKQHHKKIKFPFFSSHTQETSACSSPCQGSSLA